MSILSPCLNTVQHKLYGITWFSVQLVRFIHYVHLAVTQSFTIPKEEEDNVLMGNLRRTPGVLRKSGNGALLDLPEVICE
jgi:hypothetical protein